jgi:hypothetical protein
MIRDRLIELIKNAKAAMKAENLSCDIARNMFVADFMVANGVTVTDINVGHKADANNATTTWISVEDRLPDTDDSLLVICNGEYKNIRFINAYEFAIYDTVEDEWILESYPQAAVTVTHWMPLPNPPKGVE